MVGGRSSNPRMKPRVLTLRTLWALLVTASACAHRPVAPQESPRTCDDYTESGVSRDVARNDVVLYAREVSDHCGARPLVTQLPIARVITRAKTPECPIGDELLRHWDGQAHVEAPEVWTRLAERLRSQLSAPAPRGRRAAFIVGCPEAGRVDLLWVDVTDVRAPTAWLTHPESNAGNPTALLYAPHPLSPGSADRPPPPPPIPTAATHEVTESTGRRSVVPPRCELGPAPAGATRWIGRQLGMTDLPGPFTRRTSVLQLHGGRGTLRQFEETAAPREQPLHWKCVSETTLTGALVQDRQWLRLRSPTSVALQCEHLELAVAEASAVWHDAGEALGEGCRDWRWSPRPTGNSKVLVCDEHLFLARAPGVERPTSDTDCDSGAHRLRKIAPDGRVHPYYPKR